MEFVQSVIPWVAGHWDLVWSILTSVVTIAAAVAAVTPTPADDGIVARIRQVVDWLALNVGHAKNAEAEKVGVDPKNGP